MPSSPILLSVPRQRAGFTFLELVVVISIIASLAAMGFPAWRYYKASADRNATIALVQNIATAITQYPVKTWTWDSNPAWRPPSWIAPPGYNPMIRTAFLWDLNNSGSNPDCPAVPNGPNKYYSLDGEPDPGPARLPPAAPNPLRYDQNFVRNVNWSGYAGFYDMVRPTIALRFLSKKRQIIDAWGNPLRIAFAADTYGSSWFGLWSAGPDRRDDTDDDICSWTTSHAK